MLNESFKYQYGVSSTSSMDSGNDDILFQDKNISLIGAKGDWAAFQVIVKCDDAYTVSVGKRAVFSPYGNLCNIRVEAHVIGFDECEISMNLVGLVEDDDRILKAEILLNDEAVHITDARAQSIWVEINVSPSLSAGIYKGYVNVMSTYMFADEEKIAIMPFEITVMDVQLPLAKDYKFHLDLWQHPSNIARTHEVILWSDEHFIVMENYIKSLSALGQKAVSAIVSEIPWSGQGCFRVKNYPSDLFEYNIVSISQKTDGKLCFDFSALEKYIYLAEKHGITAEIEVLGLISIWQYEAEGYGKLAEDYPDAIRLRYLDEIDGCYKYIKKRAQIAEYISALQSFFVQKGWIDRVKVVADEPHDKALYHEALDFISEHAPLFKYKTAINNSKFIEEAKGKTLDFIPYLPAIADEWDALKKMKRENENIKLHWYVCCQPDYPNTFISSPLIESRLIGFLTAFLNLEGFLRWGYTAWPNAPRDKICYNFPCWKAGDGCFVYPARDGRVLLTLRYKNLKRGIGDYELIYRLKGATGGEKILQEVWAIIFKEADIRKYYNKGLTPKELYSLNYEDYQNARKIIMNGLLT